MCMQVHVGVCMDIYGYVRACKGYVYWYIWVCMDMHGHAGVCMGYVWVCMRM